MDKKLFRKIRALYDRLQQENYENLQGDNGQDMRDRETAYMKKLEKLLDPTPRYSKAVRAALARTLLPESFLGEIEEDGRALAAGFTKTRDIQKRIKDAEKWMYEDDAPGLRGESQMTVATGTYALHLRGVK